jgi:hypothetical protein
MAIEFIRNIISSGYNLAKINDNFAKIEDALVDGLSRSGEGPNHMEADLDMNGNDLLNIGTLQVNDITVNGENVTGVLQRAEDAAIEAEASAIVANAAKTGAEIARDEAVAAADTVAIALNNWVINSYTGDGVTTKFTLSINPGNKNNIHCYIDGVFQHTDSFNLTFAGGVTPQIEFTEAVPTGLPIEIRMGTSANVGTVSDGAITEPKLATGAVTATKIGSKAVDIAKINNSGATARLIGRATAGAGDLEEITKNTFRDVFMPSGSVIDSVQVKYTTQTAQTTGVGLVAGSTPLITQGFEILTTSFTGKAGTNKYRLRYQGMVSINAVAGVIIALFEGSTCIHATAVTIGTSGYYYNFYGEIEVPSSTSAKTYSVRVMTTNTSQLILVNGSTSSTNLLGTTAPAATLTIEEIRG